MLLTDQIPLPDCLYFFRYDRYLYYKMFVNQAAMLLNLKLTVS